MIKWWLVYRYCNSFYYSKKNIEIREDMRSIYPCPAKVSSYGNSNWTPVKMITANWY